MRVRASAAVIVTLSVAACSSATSTPARAKAHWWAYPPLSSIQYAPSQPGRSAAASYPPSVYPAPAKVTNALRCPSESGLQPFDRASRATAHAVLRGFDQRSLAADLHDTDRAWWPQLLVRRASQHGRGDSAGNVFVADRLTGEDARLAAPGLASRIGQGCGRRIARDSYLIVDADFDQPSLQDSVFLDRRGHVLLYFATTKVIRNAKAVRDTHRRVIYLGAPTETIHITGARLKTVATTPTRTTTGATTSSTR